MVKVFNYIGYARLRWGTTSLISAWINFVRTSRPVSFLSCWQCNLATTLVALPFQPRVVFNRKGRKIAVIGFTYEATGEVTHPGRVGMLEFKGYNELAIEQAKTAQAEGADASVIILHDNPAKLAPFGISKSKHWACCPGWSCA